MTQTFSRLTPQTRQEVSGNNPQADIKALSILTVSCLALFFAALGQWPLIDPGDGYFTEAAREMIESGNYITPHLNYQIYFSKPILIYWLIAGAYHLLGVNELAGRIWSAILATALVLCTYWAVRSLASRRAGIMSGLILASSPLVVTFARMSLIDMTFSSLLGIALCALLMTICAGSRRWWPVLYLALGLAVLAKGPAAIVLFALGSAAFLLFSRPSKDLFLSWCRQLHLGWGTLIFSLLTVPWYAAVGLATKGLFLKVFFLYENLGRYSGQTNHRHPELWYYLPVVAYGFFPWMLWLPPALINAFKKPPCESPALSSGKLLMFSWATAIFLFFTFSTAKLETYILPTLPALAMLVGLLLDRFLITREPQGRWLKIVSSLLAIMGIILCPTGIVVSILAKDYPSWMRAASALAVIALGIGWTRQKKFLRRESLSESFAWLLVSTTVACALLAPVAFTVGYWLKQRDLHDVALSLNNRPGQIAIFQEFKPSLMFYLRRPIDSFFGPDQLEAVKAAANANPKQYVIASDKALPLLIAKHGNNFRPVFRQGHWGAYEAKDLLIRKLPTLEQTFSQNLNLNVGNYSWGTLPFAGGTPKVKTTM